MSSENQIRISMLLFMWCSKFTGNVF